MKLERVFRNIALFLFVWIVGDYIFGTLDESTAGECIAAITMAFMLYFD